MNYLNIRLSNGSTSNVKEMFYNENHVALELPRVVFVDFGVQYTGESFFPNNPSRRGWFPIYPVENKCYTSDKKSNNGLIPSKIVANLTNKEAEHRLTYIMFSRVCKFLDIGLKGSIALYRLCHVIRKQSKMNKCIEEEK